MSQPNLVAMTTWTLKGSNASPASAYVGGGAVHLGRVEDGDALLRRAADDANGVLPLGRHAVELAHPHAAEADGGNLEVAGPERARLRVAAPSRAVGA